MPHEGEDGRRKATGVHSLGMSSLCPCGSRGVHAMENGIFSKPEAHRVWGWVSGLGSVQYKSLVFWPGSGLAQLRGVNGVSLEEVLYLRREIAGSHCSRGLQDIPAVKALLRSRSLTLTANS